ncbi:MAG: GBS Bsp-like repeat-containing protein, partial [Clostridia bacterium]|nr:GBS Bsp-like repeat-containing protein [Clostridia bacterium]
MKNKSLIIVMLMMLIILTNIFAGSEVHAAHISGCSSSDVSYKYTATGSTSTHKVEVVCNACGGVVTSSSGQHTWGSWKYLDETYHRRACTLCKGTVTGTHSDSNGDGRCDLCTAVLDNVAPTGSATIPAYTKTGKVSVSANVTDTGGSGMSDVKFPTWSDADWQDDIVWYQVTGAGPTYSTTIDLTQHTPGTEGVYHIHVYGYDNAGNTSETLGAVSVIYDKTAPSAPTTSGTKGSATGAAISSGSWTNGGVYVHLSSTDTLSGIDHYEWKNDSGTWVTCNNPASFTAERNGTQYFRAVDKAGNASAAGSFKVCIDKTKPNTPTLSGTKSSATGSAYTAGSWTNTSVYVHISSNDAASGIDHYEWKNDSGTWVTCNNPASFSADRNATQYFKVVDKAGNASDAGSFKVSIDTAAPTIDSLTASQALWAGSNITLTGKATDSASGIVAYAFVKGSGTPSYTSITATTSQTTQTYTVTSAGTYYFYTKDQAGNVSSKSITIKEAFYSVGSTYYETLQEAIAGASAGSTITVLKNVTDSSTATIGKNITLNTNGKTLTRTKTITVSEGYALSITGTGTITTASNVHTIKNSGTLNVTSATIEHTGTSTAYKAIYNYAAGTININSGTIKSNVYTIINYGIANIKGGSVLATATLDSANVHTLYTAKGATTNVTGGTISATNNATSQGARAIGGIGNKVISGGTIAAKGHNAIAIESYHTEVLETSINISGSPVISAESTTETGYSRAISAGTSGTDVITKIPITISGGTLSATGIATSSVNAIYSYRNTGEVIVTGGTITSSGRGINITAGSGALTFGDSSATLSTTAPTAQGGTYGIYAPDGFNFYNGIIKSNAAAIFSGTATPRSGYGITKTDADSNG